MRNYVVQARCHSVQVYKSEHLLAGGRNLRKTLCQYCPCACKLDRLSITTVTSPFSGQGHGTLLVMCHVDLYRPVMCHLLTSWRYD